MNIFVTGTPGCGKSTLIRQLVDSVTGDVAGIVTPEIRQNGKRQGFKLIDLTTNESAVLASVDIAPAVVGKYGVNLDGIQRIVELFLRSADEADVVFLDEIGPMELRSRRFQQAVRQVLAGDQPVVATLHRRLVDQYSEHGTVVRLTRDSFDDVKQDILQQLGW